MTQSYTGGDQDNDAIDIVANKTREAIDKYTRAGITTTRRSTKR